MDDVLADLRGTELENDAKGQLKLAYGGFKKVYDFCLSRTRTTLEPLPDKAYQAEFKDILRAHLTQLADFARDVSSEPPCAVVMEVLLALVFAWWSLEDCKSTMDSLRRGGKAFLKQPHPAQLLSLFRILGVAGSPDDSLKVTGPYSGGRLNSYFEFDAKQSAQSKLKNHMAEIKTGEGTCNTGWQIAFLTRCDVRFSVLLCDVQENLSP